MNAWVADPVKKPSVPRVSSGEEAESERVWLGCLFAGTVGARPTWHWAVTSEVAAPPIECFSHHY